MNCYVMINGIIKGTIFYYTASFEIYNVHQLPMPSKVFNGDFASAPCSGLKIEKKLKLEIHQCKLKLLNILMPLDINPTRPSWMKMTKHNTMKPAKNSTDAPTHHSTELNWAVHICRHSSSSTSTKFLFFWCISAQ